MINERREKDNTNSPGNLGGGARGGRKGSGGEFNAQWRHKRPCVNS